MSLRRIKSHVVPLVFAARFVRYRHECGKEPRMVFLFFPVSHRTTGCWWRELETMKAGKRSGCWKKKTRGIPLRIYKWLCYVNRLKSESGEQH